MEPTNGSGTNVAEITSIAQRRANERAADSPLSGGGGIQQGLRKPRFDSPGIDTPAPPDAPAGRPELDGVISRKQLFALTRYFFQDVTPQTVQAILKDLEIGRMTRPADLQARVLREPYIARADWHRRQTVAGKTLAVEPNKSAPKWKAADAQQNADVAAMVVSSLQASGTLEEAQLSQLSANSLGIALTEIEWGMRDGWWMPVAFHPILTREIWLDLDWTPTVFDRYFQRHRIAAHPGKFWCHRPQTTNGLLIDQGYFASIVWLWLFKTMLWRFRMFAAERFGTPLVVAYVEQLVDQMGTVDKATREALRDACKQLTVDSVAIAPSGTRIDVIDPKGTGSAQSYKGTADDLNTEIQVRILGMSTLFTASQVGSYSSEQVRALAVEEGALQDSRLLLGSFKRDVIGWTLWFNGLDTDPACMPEITHIFPKAAKLIDATTLSAKVASNDEVREGAGLEPKGDAWGKQLAVVAPAPSQWGTPTPAPDSPPASGGTPPASPFAPRAKSPLGGMPDLSDPRTR